MSEDLIIQWLPVLIMVPAAALFVFGNALISKLFSETKETYTKVSPYESGNEPSEDPHANVSVQYALVAVLFILFDVEIIFMYPWAMVMDVPGYAWPSIVTVFVFVLILGVGYAYAWKEGVFEWT